jgi:hypothetical protein
VGSSVRILYPRGSSLSRSRRSGKDGLSKYLCMYMPVVVSSGSSVRILYPRESYDSWADPEGPVRTVCQSTTDVVDAPASFCCHILMLMFQLRVVDVY